jgi:peptidoglycan/LPS O-acetylase OafA/YrhL
LHPGTHGSINGVNWSVALEMQFYLFVVFLIPFLLRRGLWMVFLLLPLAIGYRFLTTLIVPPVTGSNTHLQHVLAAQLPGTLDAFSLGIMLALMVHARSEFLRGLVACNWRNFFCWSVVAALVGTWTMSVYLNHAEYWNNVYMVVFWRSAIALTFACILAAAITFPGAGWLVFGPIRYLGEISYGLYLWHLPVLMTVLSVSRVEGVQLLVVVLCCTLILSAYTWHRFEKPIMERFRPA